jgi:hypothetical protein
MQQIRNFIQTEMERFEWKHNNMFTLAFAEISRYYDYLQIINERYKALSEQFLEYAKSQQSSFNEGVRQLNDEEVALLEQNQRVMTQLHLEIETFYLFAKILLDKIALAIQFYFGQARGLSLASHDKFAKNIERYANAKDLSINQDLVSQTRTLKENVSDFRDKQIHHIEHYRQGRISRGTVFALDGSVRLSLSNLFPKETDKQHDLTLGAMLIYMNTDLGTDNP